MRLFFIWGYFALTVIAHAKTIVVGAGGTVTKIREGIALASAGDTVLIRAGLYREGNILIKKSIVIRGEGQAVIDGDHKYELFTVHAPGGSISGLTFQNTGIASIEDLAAIKVLESTNLHLYRNTFINCFFGIYLANSSHILIEENQLTSDAAAEHQIGNGIHLWKCHHATLRSNRVHGHRDGIYFEFVTQSLVTENHSEGNMRYGLHFMFSHDDTYHGNTFLNNGAGVAVMYTKGVTMTHNRFVHNWGSSAYGLLLKDIRDSDISHNEFIENSIGIFMEGSSRNQFYQNEFRANGYAIRLQASCDENRFRQNNFRQNTFDIITNGSLVLNSIESNYWDRYEGYDLTRDGVGDIPYRPVSLYGTLIDRMPTAVLLWRSFLVLLLDKAERAAPAITPENLKDTTPAMKPYDLPPKHQ
ncbi:MAG: nitrous oxide reductase family maturation protein NosD [Cyclobacteriaceae bacterium]|jgi:nitrous oxidase accessory protein|nr:nitrous oxide reductase family maturation protein NosD [Cyclobacteriaceae bacterium]